MFKNMQNIKNSLNGVLGEIQTPDLQDRNLLLYSAELRALLKEVKQKL